LLTDALIDSMHPLEIAAVFGHEIGHIAHRHLYFLGFFAMGSLGVMALILKGIDAYVMAVPPLWVPVGGGDWGLSSIVQSALGLLILALYFLLVFGHLSRRFERQADVFGCRAISCGQSDCPPHADPDSPWPASGAPAAVALCPEGIRIFASALARVAALNGMEHGMRSWRHGSINRRIAFLASLEGRPEAERRFQAGISRLRLAMALILIAVMVYAVVNGAIDQLR
jgi:STE24 endopeptidase